MEINIGNNLLEAIKSILGSNMTSKDKAIAIAGLGYNKDEEINYEEFTKGN